MHARAGEDLRALVGPTHLCQNDAVAVTDSGSNCADKSVTRARDLDKSEPGRNEFVLSFNGTRTIRVTE